jgi:hypothetical protein
MFPPITRLQLFHVIKSGTQIFFQVVYFSLGIKGIMIILIFLYEYHSQLCRNFSYKVSCSSPLKISEFVLKFNSEELTHEGCL